MPGIVGYDTFIGERRAADRLWRCDADPGVIDRMVSHLAREAEVGGYDAAAEVADELVVARRRVASLLGLEHGNVSLSDSGTSATVSLFQAMATAGSSPSGGFIVTDPREFGPNHELLRRLAARSGAGIRLLGLTPEGRLDIDQLGQLVSAGRVGLVWLSLAHAHAGSTNAVSELVRALDGRPTETWVVLDACQSFGQLDDDLAALDPDAVIGTSRKWLRGPRGAGCGPPTRRSSSGRFGFVTSSGSCRDGASSTTRPRPRASCRWRRAERSAPTPTRWGVRSGNWPNAGCGSRHPSFTMPRLRWNRSGSEPPGAPSRSALE